MGLGVDRGFIFALPPVENPDDLEVVEVGVERVDDPDIRSGAGSSRSDDDARRPHEGESRGLRLFSLEGGLGEPAPARHARGLLVVVPQS